MLQKQKEELILNVKKQLKLIDIYKRQKVKKTQLILILQPAQSWLVTSFCFPADALWSC